MRIRTGGKRDYDLIWGATMETVWADLPPDEAGRLDRREFEGHFRPRARRVVESVSNVIFIAEASGRPVGYAILGPATSMLSPQTFGFLFDLWVDPGARRQGVGRQLLERAVSWCREQGYGKLKLEVSARNEAARALYRGEGFAEERVYMGLQL